MAQVSMTGKEYEDLLQAKHQYEELIGFLKKERKIKFTEDNIHTYSSGEFPTAQKFPDAITEALTLDMVSQLLHMDADEFGLWATTDHHFYDVKGREMNSWAQNRNIDLLELSPSLKERWDLVKAEVKAEIEEDAKDGEWSNCSDGSL